jgi:hypothetical protein
VSEYYAKSLPGSLIYRAEVRRRTSERHHALICTCYEVETAERIAAALNAQAGVVEALKVCVNEIEFINSVVSTGKGGKDRADAIAKARAALAAVKGVKP